MHIIKHDLLFVSYCVAGVPEKSDRHNYDTVKR